MSGPEAHEEIERKYHVDDEARLPAVPGLASGEPEAALLRAVYYDTASRALARSAIALRRREGGHDEGWHLKSPGELGRLERQAPLSADPPPELLEIVAGITAGSPLEPIARITTHRTTVLLSDGEAELVELADDRVEADDVARGVSTGWREWEAELLPGAPIDVLDRVDEALRRAGARDPLSGSKLARALGRQLLG